MLSPVSALLTEIEAPVGRSTQPAGCGVTSQSGSGVPVSNATLPISVTPSGIGSTTVTTTVNTRLLLAGTVRPDHVTTPLASPPPLSADTKTTFGSSGSVTP